MGRKIKYHTKEEKHNAQLRWQREYYYRNRKRILKKAKEKYFKLKNNKLALEISKTIYGE